MYNLLMYIILLISQECQININIIIPYNCKVKHIELSALVNFIFIAKMTIPQPKINSHKESQWLALASANCSSSLALSKLTFPIAVPTTDVVYTVQFIV